MGYWFRPLLSALRNFFRPKLNLKTPVCAAAANLQWNVSAGWEHASVRRSRLPNFPGRSRLGAKSFFSNILAIVTNRSIARPFPERNDCFQGFRSSMGEGECSPSGSLVHRTVASATASFVAAKTPFISICKPPDSCMLSATPMRLSTLPLLLLCALTMTFAIDKPTTIQGGNGITLPPPPPTEAKPVTETVHGHTITDPYRWLEDAQSSGHARVDRRADELHRGLPVAGEDRGQRS